jgi:beta-1,4-mannosyl-glycoprotein beta-1,4-N-acetylglucosaminyltransferase
MKIIDCFIFYNEYNLLLMRFTELYDIVDQFVIVEATSTHSGKEKELNFKNNLKLYEKFLDKITYIIVNDMPNTANAWDNENYQRACIDKGIKKLNLDNDDIIMITDCDEIPNKNTLKLIKENKIQISRDYIYGLDMDFYYYNFTCKQDIQWTKGKLLTLEKYNNSLMNNKKRLLENIRSMQNKLIQNGGWHLSFFGNTDFIINKIKNFAHQEHNTDACISDIENNVNNNKCIFNKRKLKNINIKDNNNLPENYKIMI